MCKQASCHLIGQSRHRYERLLFGLASLFTLLALIAVVMVGLYKQETLSLLRETAVAEYRADHPEAANLTEKDILAKLSDEEKEAMDMVESVELPLVLLAPLAIFILIVYQVGHIYGSMRADGILVGPQQFGRVHTLWCEMAQQLGMKTIPELYIKNGNGTLNAFATCLPGYRPFGAIYSDILERALANEDETALRFILGHELGHIRLNHVAWWAHMMIMAGNFPGANWLLGLPLSRAREYSCDKLGMALSGDDKQQGLMMLAAGKHLYRQVDMAAYEAEHIGKRSFWAAVNNFFADHANISWRIAALREQRHGDLFWPSKRRR